ncbi:hypothetical protein ACSMXN_05610 [Jatrophihabitans sp. DSM 45814]
MAADFVKIRQLAELIQAAAPLAAEINSGYYTPEQRSELRRLVGKATFLHLTDDLGQLYVGHERTRAADDVIDMIEWRRENPTQHYDR